MNTQTNVLNLRLAINKQGGDSIAKKIACAVRNGKEVEIEMPRRLGFKTCKPTSIHDVQHFLAYCPQEAEIVIKAA